MTIKEALPSAVEESRKRQTNGESQLGCKSQFLSILVIYLIRCYGIHCREKLGEHHPTLRTEVLG